MAHRSEHSTFLCYDGRYLSGAGYNMIILLAGMQGVSNSYYEAAEIDGAGPVQ